MNATYNSEYKQKLKTAFIGCGGHAVRNIYPTFLYAPVHLVSVCDLDLTRAQEVQRLFGAERSYTDHHEMLAREKPDVVFVVTNYDPDGNPRYPAIAADVMNAGAHVWIEKPPASSVDQVLAMMKISRATERFVGVGFKKMFFPANVKAAEITANPAFGRITSISASYPEILPPLKDRMNASKMLGFLDHMVHPHSLLRRLAGDIEWIFVNRNERIGSSVVSMRFKNGAVGNLHFAGGKSRLAPMERTEIVGEGESVVIDNNIRLSYYRKAKGPVYGRGTSFFGSDEDAPLHWEPEFSLGQLHNKGIFLLGYAPEVIHFTTGLLEGKPPRWGTLDDALELLRVYGAYRKADGEIVLV